MFIHHTGQALDVNYFTPVFKLLFIRYAEGVLFVCVCVFEIFL